MIFGSLSQSLANIESAENFQKLINIGENILKFIAITGNGFKLLEFDLGIGALPLPY